MISANVDCAFSSNWDVAASFWLSWFLRMGFGNLTEDSS